MSVVRVEDVNGVRWVTFHRPEKLNALMPDDIDAIRAGIADLDGVRAVVFAGTGGRAFCAGMHVDAFGDLTPDTARAFISGVRDLFRSVRTAPIPALAAVDGYCLGFGFELALACDLRVASTRSSFGLPEIKVGVPSVVDSALLQQYVGLGLAKEMILTGDSYPVSELTQFGLCHPIVEAEHLQDAVEAMLAKVTGHTRAVTASQKRLFEAWQNCGLTEGIDVSIDEFAEVFASDETASKWSTYRHTLTGPPSH